MPFGPRILPIFGSVRASRSENIAPGEDQFPGLCIRTAGTPPSSLFPFQFCRQTLSLPCAVSLRIVPVDVDDWGLVVRTVQLVKSASPVFGLMTAKLTFVVWFRIVVSLVT